MNIYITMYVILFSIFPLVLKGQDHSVKANIVVDQQENLVKIQAKATNSGELIEDLNYLLVSIKQSKTGNLSNNRQDGKFVINPDETQQLSSITVNFSADDQIKIYLFIRDEKDLISKDSLFINVDKDDNIKIKPTISKTNNSVEEASVKEEDFILSGIVLDETKSKVGKDFYDLFYSKYNLLSDKYPFIITISELPSTGRNGILNIQVGDKVLHTFRTMPKEEYLTAQVDFTLKRVNGYNREIKLIDKELKAP